MFQKYWTYLAVVFLIQSSHSIPPQKGIWTIYERKQVYPWLFVLMRGERCLHTFLTSKLTDFSRLRIPKRSKSIFNHFLKRSQKFTIIFLQIFLEMSNKIRAGGKGRKRTEWMKGQIRWIIEKQSDSFIADWRENWINGWKENGWTENLLKKKKHAANFPVLTKPKKSLNSILPRNPGVIEESVVRTGETHLALVQLFLERFQCVYSHHVSL